jgi:transketolase C-terminal domain/subunit
VYESKGYLPFSVARNLKILLNKNIENLKSLQIDYNVMKMIKIKIQDNNLLVAEANKNKTVVLQKHNYNDKIYTFI